MENLHSYAPMLELLDRPAFLVDGGIIVLANRAARQKMISTGDPITKYLAQDLQAYQDFRGGCLYLRLQIEGIHCDACLTDLESIQLFALDENTEPQLKALSLAAQQLRASMNNIFITAEQMADRQYSGKITRSLNQMHRTLCNMSDAVLYQTQQAVQTESTNLNSLFSEIVEKAATLVKSTGCRIHFTALPQDIYGMADRQLLERAVLNLISNAVKFSHKDSAVEIKLASKGTMLSFTVRDSGEGIPSQIRQNVFTRYLRNPGIEDSRFGMGLGLTLVRAAAAAHGGTVLIDCPEGGGTRVTMTLSLAPRETDQLRSPVSLPVIDYAGGHDHALLELSDVLPHNVYK